MHNVKYLVKIKNWDQNSAAPVGFEADSRRTVELTFHLV